MIFAKKFNIFFLYFFLEIKPEYVQSAVLDKKDALLFYKNVHFSKSQTRNFPRGLTRFFSLEYRETNFPGLFCLNYKLKLEKLPLFNQTMD